MSGHLGVPALRTAKGVRNLIEQRIALGHSHERIARELDVTVEQVDQVRDDMDTLIAEDQHHCERCGEQVHAVSVHHASGRTTVHRTCPQGHRYRPTAPNGRRLSIVRGER